MHLPSLLASTALLALLPLADGQCRERAMYLPAAQVTEVEVLDRSTGEHLPIYWHDGQRWVAGTPGHRYAVTLRNRTPGRVLGVVSVDGVNVLSGETADWAQSGYVLSPWESFDVLGWRKSQQRVADFVFTALDDSYAARTGRPDNVGVIGVALFHEVRHYAPPVGIGGATPRADTLQQPESRDAPAATAPAPASAPETSRAQESSVAKAAPSLPKALGTGHGDSESSLVYTTEFERAQDRPNEVISIRYDRYERLVAMGVIPGSDGPRAFPGSADSGFVPDPPVR